MTATTPVERISEMLTGAGYQRLTTPLRIAGLTFDFPAVFIGTAHQSDLIVIADTAFESEQRILKKVEGVARAMDVVRSTRPLTAVLAGPRPVAATLGAMSRVCRVLIVGAALEGDPQAALWNSLAVLMPLRLPQPTSEVADPIGEVARQVADLDPGFQELLKAAPQGAEAVRNRLYELIAEPLSGVPGAKTP